MTSAEKPKKGKDSFPAQIQYSIILSYFITNIVLYFLLAIVPFNINQGTLFAGLTMGIAIIGMIIGWVIKWWWAKKNGTDEQRVRVRAQFWSTMGFIVALITSLLTILIALIILETNQQIPQTLPDWIIFLISMTILLIGVGIAWNTRQRILRNFGY